MGYSRKLIGKGLVRGRRRQAVPVYYTIETSAGSGQGTVVEFDPKPPAEDGDLVYLTLEDGRVLQCQILDDSPFCAVVGDGPVVERRSVLRAEIDD